MSRRSESTSSTIDISNYLETNGIIDLTRTPPRRSSPRRSPPRLVRSSRSRSPPRVRSHVSSFPTFPRELRGVMVPVDLRPIRRSSPRSLHRASPRSPPEYVKNLNRSLRELENTLPGLPMSAPRHLPFQPTKKRLLEDFLEELRVVARSAMESKHFKEELIKVLDRLHRNKTLTTGQFQKLRQLVD
jgi:hypothetical protein